MRKVLSVKLIKSKLKACPVCNYSLQDRIEEVATYSGKGKRRKVESYVSAKLNYCKCCDLYYIKQANLDKIRSETKNSVQLINDSTKHQEEPPQASLPLVQSHIHTCPICRRPLGTSTIKTLIHTSESSRFAHGFLGIIVPYCRVCRKNYISPKDTLLVNDLMLSYKRLSGQPKLEEHELVRLVKNRLGIDGSGETTCTQIGFAHSKRQQKTVQKSDCKNETTHDDLIHPHTASDSNILYAPLPQILRDVHICFGEVHCYRNNHRIQECKVSVYCSDTNGHVSVSSVYANYCTTCNKYFMQHTVFKRYQDRYGNLLVKFIPAYEQLYHSELRGDYFLLGLKKESLLHVLGYNTLIESAVRKLRLVTIMACGQMKKYEIIRHLDYLIRFNSNNSNHYYSMRKWKEDLEFVADYELDEHDQVFGQIVMRTRMLWQVMS